MNINNWPVEIIPAQPGSYVVTLNKNLEPVEYPMACWVRVPDENPDPEIQETCDNLYGCFSVDGSLIDERGELYLVSRIGRDGFLPGEVFREYKFVEAA